MGYKNVTIGSSNVTGIIFFKEIKKPAQSRNGGRAQLRGTCYPQLKIAFI